MVIEGHVRLFGFGIGTYDNLSSLMFYSVNMPIFFFVSGFLAYKGTVATSLIAKKTMQKFKLLVIPAVVFKLFLDLLRGQNPIHVLKDGFGEYWFTITLFECFIIYYLIILLVKQRGLQMIILAALALLGIVILCIYGKVGPAFVDLNHLIKYFHFFVFGLFAMCYYDSFERAMHNGWIKTLAIVVFFAILFVINKPIWPSFLFHLMRDLFLRYVGTFIFISFFVCNSSFFDKKTRYNDIICSVGEKSMAIYLLQYFFMPNFSAFPEWVAGLDEVTIHMISFAYTFIITAICMLFISLLSNSSVIKQDFLGIKK